MFGLGDILEQEVEDEGTLDDGAGDEETVESIEPEAEMAVSVDGGRFFWSADFGKPTLSISNIGFPSGRHKNIKIGILNSRQNEREEFLRSPR